jgi:hypothetical protein
MREYPQRAIAAASAEDGGRPRKFRAFWPEALAAANDLCDDTL